MKTAKKVLSQNPLPDQKESCFKSEILSIAFMSVIFSCINIFLIYRKMVELWGFGFVGDTEAEKVHLKHYPAFRLYNPRPNFSPLYFH